MASGSTGSMLIWSISDTGISRKVSMMGSPSPSRTGRNISPVLRLFPAVVTLDHDGPAPKRLREARQRRDVHEGNGRGHLVREPHAPAGVGVQHLAGLLHRIEDAAIVDGRERVEPELQRGDDPEVAPAALEAPEQVSVLVGAHAHQFTA